jgi:hypothetical protein
MNKTQPLGKFGKTQALSSVIDWELLPIIVALRRIARRKLAYRRFAAGRNVPLN